MKFRSILISLVLMVTTSAATAFASGQDEFSQWQFDETVAMPDSLAEFIDYARADTIMRLGVVLSDIYSKKDMEFSRGLLLGMKNAGLPSQSVSLKLINGEVPEDSLLMEIEDFAPHVLVSTFEKDAPPALRSYVQQNHNVLLNVFDVKGDDYLYNDNIFQILPPPDKFNENVARYLLDNFQGDVLMLVGDPDGNDPFMREIILAWPTEELMIVSKEDLKVFSFDEGINYLIYPLLSSYDDVKEVMNETVRMIAETPSAGVKIFGKPNWITFNDLPALISNMEAFIPAKCYFDPSTERGKRFIGSYNAAFGHAPIRSYPVYAVMGSDVASYFLPRLLETLRGTAADWEPREMDQSFFNILKSDFGGFYNDGGFILHFEPWGSMSKEKIG